MNSLSAWRIILSDRLPFASPEKLLSWKLPYDSGRFQEDPYEETFTVVFEHLHEWSRSFLKRYSTSNPKYVKHSLLQEDFVQEVIVFISRDTHEVGSVEVCSRSLLQLASGLSEDFCASCRTASYEGTDEASMEDLMSLLASFGMSPLAD